MSTELCKALLLLLASCIQNEDCNKCVLREFCGKAPTEWC